MANELTVKRMISFNGRNGDYVNFDTISEEQKELFRKSAGERMSFVLSNMSSDLIFKADKR